MRLSSEILPVLESAVRALEKAGARLKPGWPSAFSLSELFSTYSAMLAAFLISMSPPEEHEKQRAEFAALLGDRQLSGARMDFASWQRHNLRRLAFRAAWQEYFREVDAFLLPVLPVPAFPHDHTDQTRRTLSTPQGPLPYMRALLTYMSVANLTGCPATVAPVGKTAGGLPVGIQILGPYLEDATPIRLAGLLTRQTGGYSRPPGY